VARIPDEMLEAFRANHRQLRKYEKSAMGRLQTILKRSAEDLRAKVADLPVGNFRRHQAKIVEEMSRALQSRTPRDMDEFIGRWIDGVSNLGVAHAGKEIGQWADHYGKEIRPIDLDAVWNLEEEVLTEKYPASLARYGQELSNTFATTLQTALVSRTPTDAVIDTIDKTIEGTRWQAERIVRTEMSNAYNGGHQRALEHARDTGQAPEMQKSAVATFDQRTDRDSYPVHGQVRELEEPFTDGKGRTYQHPPGRPNDREVQVAYLDRDAEIDGHGGSKDTIGSREEGVKRAEKAKAKVKARRKRARLQKRRRKDKARKRKGLPPKKRPDEYGERVEYHLLNWTNGSKRKHSIELKQAAAEEFGLEGRIYNPRDHGIDPELVGETREDLRAMYAEAQEVFWEQGERKKTLYRGVKEDYGVEGTLESWTDDPDEALKFADGDPDNVMVEEVDVRRILTHKDAPHWVNGKYGDQGEYVVMPQKPALQWEKRDFDMGFFRAAEVDPDAQAAGQFGIVDQGDGATALYHRPTAETLLEGRSYTKGELKQIAQELDRGGHFDAAGDLTEHGQANLADTLEDLRLKRGDNPPDGTPVQAHEIREGRRMPSVNADVDPGPDDTWSKREDVQIVIDDLDGVEYETTDAYTQKQFAIVHENPGAKTGDRWTLRHLPTGEEIYGGANRLYQPTKRTGTTRAFGGFSKKGLEKWADYFDQYFDEGGGVKPDMKDDFHEALRKLEREPEMFDPEGWDGSPLSDEGLDWLETTGRKTNPKSATDPEKSVKAFTDGDDKPSTTKTTADADSEPEEPQRGRAHDGTVEEAVEIREQAGRNGRAITFRSDALEEEVNIRRDLRKKVQTLSQQVRRRKRDAEDELKWAKFAERKGTPRKIAPDERDPSTVDVPHPSEMVSDQGREAAELVNRMQSKELAKAEELEDAVEWLDDLREMERRRRDKVWDLHARRRQWSREAEGDDPGRHNLDLLDDLDAPKPDDLESADAREEMDAILEAVQADKVDDIEELEDALEGVQTIERRHRLEARPANVEADLEDPAARWTQNIEGPETGGANPEAQFVRVKGGSGEEHRAIFKPTELENQQVLDHLGVDEMAKREAAAARVDEILPGDRVVPPTVKRELDIQEVRTPKQIDEAAEKARQDRQDVLDEWEDFKNGWGDMETRSKSEVEAPEVAAQKARQKRQTLRERAGVDGDGPLEGSVQVLDEDATLELNELSFEAPTLREDLMDNERWHKLMTKDAITGQMDRHSANLMWRTEAGEVRPVAIDNGLSFTGNPKAWGGPRAINGWDLEEYWGAARGYREKLQEVDLERFGAEVAGELEDETFMTKAAMVRLRALQQDPDVIRTLPGETHRKRMANFFEQSMNDPEGLLGADGMEAVEEAYSTVLEEVLD